MKKQNVLVLLSSGLDSTYCAYKLLSEGVNITPVYFEIAGCNEQKTFTEKQQSLKILNLLKKDFPKMNVPDLINHIVPYESSQRSIRTEGIIHILGRDETGITHVALGQNQSDFDNEDMVSDFQNFKTQLRVRLGKYVVEPIFPVENLNKREIYNLLPKKYHKELYCCELPPYIKNEQGKWETHSCGKCNSCFLQKMIGIYEPKVYSLPIQLPDSEAKINNQTCKDYDGYFDYYEGQGGSKSGIMPIHLKKEKELLISVTR